MATSLAHSVLKKAPAGAFFCEAASGKGRLLTVLRCELKRCSQKRNGRIAGLCARSAFGNIFLQLIGHPFLSYKPLFSCSVCRESCTTREGSLRAQVARCLGFEALPASYGANSRIGRKSAAPLPSATLWRSAWLRASLGARRCGWWSRGGRILVSGGRNRGSHVGLRP